MLCAAAHSQDAHVLTHWHAAHRARCPRKDPMLYTIALVLIVLWLLGLVSAYTMGGFIHILLVVAVVMILVNLINGRKPL